jgi:hypothetical protein
MEANVNIIEGGKSMAGIWLLARSPTGPARPGAGTRIEPLKAGFVVE